MATTTLTDHRRSPFIRYMVTGVFVVLAVLLAWMLWYHYFRSPWTRDARVRADVVNISPEVSGVVVDLKVRDNQQVKKGDILFVINPVDYKYSLIEAEANVRSKQFDLKVAQENFDRRHGLTEGEISTEDKQKFQDSALSAEASLESAQASRDQDQANLDRTVVRSPVNGYVTNLILRIGDYATSGQSKLTIVDSDSFWVAGYFEETKLSQIREGDGCRIRLMGWDSDITGHIESLSHAIADNNTGEDSEGLAKVDPDFTWVRLAQRIPIRIHIDHVPSRIRIAAGQTCTVVVDPTDDPVREDAQGQYNPVN